MDIQKNLIENYSREMADKIVAYIGDDTEKFNDLMILYDSEVFRSNQRASWVVSIAAQKNPALIYPHVKTLLKKLDEEIHHGIRRNTIRAFEAIEIPESIEGELYDKCCKYLASMNYAIAVKAFSLTVATRIAVKYPELQTEVLELIDYQLPHSTTAFKVRAKRARFAFKK